MTKFMTYSSYLIAVFLFTASCVEKTERVVSQPVDWEARVADLKKADSLISGSTYLSTHSEIYTYSENDYRPLTITVSMRNVNKTDSVIIHNIEYFNTHGTLVKSYIDKAVYIRPMETVEIVIQQLDKEGGSGANFVFDWYINTDSNAPIFEGVMVSHSGTQAFSFITQGIRVDNP